MTVREHLLAAEGHLLMADTKIVPRSEDEKVSPQLHTAMFHLEAALAISEGRNPHTNELELLNAS